MEPYIIANTHLYRVTSIEYFETYFSLKCDPSAIMWSGFKTAPDREKLLDHFMKLIANPDIYLYFMLANSDEEIAGYAQLNREKDNVVEFAGYCLIHKYQGHGYSRRMAALIHEKIKELKFDKIQGWISEKNYASLRWLGSFGMKDTGERKVVRMQAFDRDDTFHLYSLDL